jgi:hypothetical protein
MLELLVKDMLEMLDLLDIILLLLERVVSEDVVDFVCSLLLSLQDFLHEFLNVEMLLVFAVLRICNIS